MACSGVFINHTPTTPITENAARCDCESQRRGFLFDKG